MSDLLFSVKDHVAYITMNRPDSLNAFSEEMIVEWIKALEEVRDSDDIRVVVLSGNGRGFCAGGDIKEMSREEDFLTVLKISVVQHLTEKIQSGKKFNEYPYYFKK